MPSDVKRWTTPAAFAADILRAEASYGPNGQRQIRGVDIGECTYLDERDVQWIIDTYQRVVNRQRCELFWANVGIVALLRWAQLYSLDGYPWEYSEFLPADDES